MDPRAARSRTQLQDALLALARERPIDEISVADITAHAGVNRSTFYLHYRDKDTLLADALTRAIDLEIRPPRPVELQGYLEHIRDNVELYRRVLGEHGSPAVAGRLRASLGAVAADIAGQAGHEPFPGVPADVAGEGLAGAAMGVIMAWLRRDPLPPVEIAAAWITEVQRGPQ